MDISRCVDVVWLQLILFFIHFCTAIRTPYSDLNQKSNRIVGDWGDWGHWSSCSVECGTGISSRTRRCKHPLTLPDHSLRLRSDYSVECDGGGREIKVCNSHKCPPNVTNVREKQCRKFNARVFNGKKYNWEPYINPNNKCELTCRAKGQHFYARLANRVGDGTPCGIHELAVCIHRKCIEVGCDGLVGSNAKLDKCGVCKGDNSSCRTISGVFNRPNLPHGYSKIITIPAGSTNINITELRPSTNYLSLHTASESVLNGNWAISSSGDYEAAGTSFTYKKDGLECPGECIFSKGPTNENVELKMLVYHKNPGVMYSFNVPMDVTESYFRDLISHNEEKHAEQIQATTRPTTTTTGAFAHHPELANMKMPKSTDKIEVSEVEDVSEAFREELSPGMQRQVDIEEGIEERPQNSLSKGNGKVSYGDRGYEFHEGNGQTVVLKANAGSWFGKSNESESQSQDGPSFVLAELGSKDKNDQVEDTSLEVVEGESVLKQNESFAINGETQTQSNLYSSEEDEDDEDEESEESDEDEESEESEESDEYEESEESEEGGMSLSNEKDTSEENSFEEVSKEDSMEQEYINPGLQFQSHKDVTSQMPGTLENRNDDSEKRNEDEDKFDGEDEKEEEEIEEPYDKSRGDETLGLGDGLREPERTPIPTRAGYRLTTRAHSVPQDGYGHNMKSQEYTYNKPTSTRAAPTPTQRYTQPSSTEPQRDSRFKTYSRTLGQSHVRPAIKRTGRPIFRRIPKYSQSFTFRDRYKALISAQRKRLSRRRQQLLGGGSATPATPVNRRIDGSSNVRQGIHQRNQRTHADRTRIRHNRHRHHHQASHRPVVTTDPSPVRIDSTKTGGSQSLRLGQTSESRFASSRTRGETSSGLGSSVTLKANIDQNKAQERNRDLRLSPGYRAQSNTRQNLESQRGSSGHQPSLNSRVQPKPFDRAIDPRQKVHVTDPRQKVDSRTIVDETLALGQFNRPKDKRIVIPPEPTIVNQKPVINSRPVYENFGSSQTNGEPLTKYTNGVDPITGLPSLVTPNRQPLRQRNTYIDNSIPTSNRQATQISNGALSNEILGSNYVWRVSGFSDCTQTCGGGVQQTVVVCVDTRTQAVVTDENCGGLKKPSTTAVTCNTRPCPASWETTPWSVCSVSCGPGAQSRTVTCRSRVSATLNLTMPDSSCTTQKPSTRQACEITPCYKWVPGTWTKCSSRCGPGTRRRDVTCTDATDNPLNSQLCTTPKPAQEESCDMGSCGKGWYFTDWPTECPASCGEGTLTRKTMCAGDNGEALNEARCDKLNKPTVEKTCKVDTPCGGNWFIGEWSKCNATCGYAVRSRDVVCVKNLPGGILAVVTEENCKGKEKPETEEKCELNPCQSEWYMTSWAQCTKTCGTGHRTREVKCLDPHQQPSGDCPTKGKPRTREACNTQKCVARPKPTRPSGGDCKDSFSQCKLVKKARLCRYGYYAKMCCLSCSNES